MMYEVFKLRFETGVHFGNGKLSDVEHSIMADTLFSALCTEAMSIYGTDGIERIVKYANEGSMLVSDLMPVCGDEYYIPKPIMRIESNRNGESDQKKEFKKLSYIRIEALQDYISGELDAADEREHFKNFGREQIRTMACVNEKDDTKPFSVGTFLYGEDWSLYFILAYDKPEVRDYVEELLLSLELSGLGGKRSAGLGKFELDYGSLPEIYESKLNEAEHGNCCMSLSVCMAGNDELVNAIEKAHYKVIRRGGYVASYDYADTWQRKKDFYMFQAGSTFGKAFEGVIQDVSSGGSHPVYRYGKPLFLEVSK